MADEAKARELSSATTSLRCSSVNIVDGRSVIVECSALNPFEEIVKKFLVSEEGAALAEYGVLVAFIAIVAITAVTFFGSKVSAKFSSLATSFT